jgi:CRP-like cAMP-binding protein
MSDHLSHGAIAELKNSQKFAQALRFQIFKDLSDDLVRALVDNASVVHASKATDVLVQGRPAPGLAIVIYGQVEVTYQGTGGEKVCLHIAGPGAVLGATEVLAEQNCLATCTALAGCTVLMLQQSDVGRLLSLPQFSRNYAEQIYQNLHWANEFRVVDQYRSVDQRVCRYLISFADRSGMVRRNQSDVAEAIGCSRQTVNRVLGELRAKDIVKVKKGSIQILDREMLGRVSA